MDVTLLEPASGDGDQVQIAGEGISGFALWRGGSGQAAGELVSVELDARSEISWREVVIDPQATELVGKVRARALTIRGVVEDLDQDGVITIRLAGGVFLLETSEEAPLGVVGHEVGVTIPQVDVYPTGT